MPNVRGQSPVPCTDRIAHRTTVERAADRLNGVAASSKLVSSAATMVVRHSPKISLLSLSLAACLAACGGSTDATSSASAAVSAKSGTSSAAEKSSSAATAAATSTATSSADTPAGGATLTIAEAHDAARNTPESVNDKKVRVKGVVAKLITQTAGTKSTHNVKLVPSASENSPHIYCDFGSAAPSVTEGASVTFECTGRITKNAPKNAPLELRDCTVAP